MENVKKEKEEVKKEEKSVGEIPEMTQENADKIIDDSITDMPEVHETPPETSSGQETQPQQTKPQENTGLTDRHGNTFSDSVHATDENGKPLITSDGNLKLKHRGKKAKQELFLADQIAQQRNEELNRKYMAEASANAFVQTGVVFFGDEWQPQKDKDYDEKRNLVVCFDDYYKMANIKDVPPGLALAIGLSGYALRRVAKPRTKSVLRKMKDGAINLFKKVLRKKGKKSNGTFVDTRDNGERKNDVSDKDKPQV